MLGWPTMFASLEIDGFRGFGALRLEGLGRVNLIMGKNNPGKTSLLEAITLLGNHQMIQALPGLFRANTGLVADRFFPWLVKDGRASASLSARVGDSPRRIALAASPAQVEGLTRMTPRLGDVRLWVDSAPSLRVHAVSVQHRSPEVMVDSFAEAVRAPLDEQQLVALLASVDPRVTSVRLDSVESKPFIVVDIGLSKRVPLSQAGQGIYRLVAVFSELLGSRPDLCFIDELENGIHYTSLAAVWRGIAEVAARLDIQVFATTHSWECLLAAHEAFSARDAYDFRVIQLYRMGEETEGRVLGRPHIEAAIAGQIELR